VVGGASAAVSGALTLLNYASEVHLVCEKLDVADTLKKQLQESTAVIHEGRRIKQIVGEKNVEGLVLDDASDLAVQGVFIELGAKGLMQLATQLGVQLDDEMKYIQADKKMRTNIPGIFAAGDICGPPWQMAKAVGEGCVAGIEAANYAKKIKSA
jgi:thioredoxin reductase (NADPH)